MARTRHLYIHKYSCKELVFNLLDARICSSVLDKLQAVRGLSLVLRFQVHPAVQNQFDDRMQLIMCL
ncbi:hypothetical protein HanIR_Chr14g0676691 [Helianthus annuus]|nr:hypothetical protein HanIR_Chr14g0676691 [Helianthus annuus]